MPDSIDLTLAALRPLLGTWEGAGHAEFPTIAPHEYVETLRFATEFDRPHLHYEQRARHRPIGTSEWTPSQWESGFVRIAAPGVVEWTNVQANGRLEVARLEVTETPDGITLVGETIHFLNDPRMLRARREITVSQDTLRYRLDIATTSVERLTGHLVAELRRIDR